MASTTEITCKCGCGRKRMVRTADVKRGWGRYFNKSCKAKHQESRTGQYRKYLNRENNGDILDDNWGHIFASGYEGHGQE